MAFHFEFDGYGSGEEPVRGLIGVVRNTAAAQGSSKAINGLAEDQNTTTGARALTALEAGVEPTSATRNARVISARNKGGADDVAVAINVSTGPEGNNPRWQSGLVFEEDNEFNAAVIQAAIGQGSGANARFLKLKGGDHPSVVLFDATRDGDVCGASVVAGVSTSNALEMTTSTIERTHPDGNISLVAGENSGRQIHFETGRLPRAAVDDAELRLAPSMKIVFGNASTGAFITSGIGSPDGVISAPVGSLFTRTDSGAGSRLYFTETGSGATGWIGK